MGGGGGDKEAVWSKGRNECEGPPCESCGPNQASGKQRMLTLDSQALFAGHDKTPVAALSVCLRVLSSSIIPLNILIVKEFVSIATGTGLIFPLFHRHMAYMLESHLGKKRDRTYFNSLNSHAGVLDFLDDMGFVASPSDGACLSRFASTTMRLTHSSLGLAEKLDSVQ